MFKKKEILPLVIIFSMFVLAFSFYSAPCMPDQLPTHWNSMGEVDSYGSKSFVLWFFPLLTLGLYLLMTFLPKIDPLKKNYQKFESSYFMIRSILVIFFAFLYFYTLTAGLGYAPKINYFIIPFLSLLFVVIGFSLPQIEKNYFVGIRTPWTLQSEEVWKRTHKIAGYSFVACGILSLFTLLLRENAFLAFIPLVIVGSLVPSVYSYVIYKKMGLFKKR